MVDIFENRAVDEEQLENINKIKEKASILYQEIIDFCPNDREQAIAIVALEECIMWAAKGVAHEREGFKPF